MKNREPVIVIGLDAVELSLVERLCSEGKLPNLQFMRENGCFGKLQSDAHLFAGGVWPTFYTSKTVPWHGIYHNKLWRFERMRCEVASKEWLPNRPLWEYLDGQEYRIAVVDVPMTLGTSKMINGIHLCGWGTHDLVGNGSWPPNFWKRMEGKFGGPVIEPEYFGPQTGKSLKRLRKQLLMGTEQLVEVGEYILAQNSWDLFLIVFGAGHRAGHYLWDLSQIKPLSISGDLHRSISGALEEIYMALDRGVGRLRKKAPKGAKVMVFAVHGMGPNCGWSDWCPKLLAMIQEKDEGRPAKSGFLYGLRQAMPWSLIRQVTRHMPKPLLDRLVSLWSSEMFDWSQTRYFPLPMDHAGYIRINVKGREPQGIVESGSDYNELCRQLEAALKSFCDVTSGKPIVDNVYRPEHIAPSDSTFRKYLPDLVVTWKDISAIESRGIRSERYGELLLDGFLPSGRSGNHNRDGWFFACGPGIEPKSHVQGSRVMDLAPTLFRWLGAPVPYEFQGRPIADLCADIKVRD
jgi:predicted AlkP superfamily phosphohydrolase/phosphomutase